jgi:glucose-6-phosphate dehydrogenase assembly protein OpcA
VSPDQATVELSDVEAALARLRGDDSHGSVRATTLNLVVTCPDAEAAAHTDEVLDALGGSRPLRAIMVTPGAKRPKARVSSACWTGAGQEVCAERIAISGERVALPSAVVSLLVADLPVFVWWQGVLPDDGDGVLGELTEIASRVIVDSDDTGLEAAARLEPRVAGLVDIAWVRTGPWRESIAAMFDGRPQRRALDHLIGVEVVGPPNQAALLAGWLRSRLDRQVGVDVRKAKRLNRVELHCGDDVFLVERAGRNHHGVASGAGLADRTFPLPPEDLISLLAAELDRLGAEPTFEQALAAAHAA